MSSTPTQSNTPRFTSGRVHDGAYTNSNINPLANTLNGNTDSFVSSTYIQNHQCQNPQSHYTHCNFYAGDHTPGAQKGRASNPIAQVNVPDLVPLDPHPRHRQGIELRSPFVVFYWLCNLLSSFIRVFPRAAAAISSAEHTPRDILPRHIQDVEDHPSTAPSFIPSWAPTSPEDDLV
ncbi:hypothetical protein PQX77_017207 [Marasmius sp. AFHP31]|nr:hypothetical protein PQX77_017207 [Marasmius sp. AFHP31]